MDRQIDHICIGVCTYKRPGLLDRLLTTLKNQSANGLLTYSIVVVDNDHQESAKDVVIHHQKSTTIPIRYLVEPEQNISLARNKALKNADGQFFAGIDDDEFADDQWLANLFLAVKKYNADGVLGPVLPFFESLPPSWVVKGAFFDRESFPTGTILTNPKYTRSGNFLISSKLIRENRDLFNPEFGLTGGEDSDFFKRMIEKNYTFIWCQEAKVNETIPPARLTRSYLLKRALLRGCSAAKRASLLSFDTAKSLLAFLLYTLALPFLLLFRHHLFMRYLIKDCDHIGKILARCGIKVITQWSELAPLKRISPGDPLNK